MTWWTPWTPFGDLIHIPMWVQVVVFVVLAAIAIWQERKELNCYYSLQQQQQLLPGLKHILLPL